MDDQGLSESFSTVWSSTSSTFGTASKPKWISPLYPSLCQFVKTKIARRYCGSYVYEHAYVGMDHDFTTLTTTSIDSEIKLRFSTFCWQAHIVPNLKRINTTVKFACWNGHSPPRLLGTIVQCSGCSYAYQPHHMTPRCSMKVMTQHNKLPFVMLSGALKHYCSCHQRALCALCGLRWAHLVHCLNFHIAEHWGHFLSDYSIPFIRNALQ